MQVDAFAIRLRPRNNLEAADLGVRLCQVAARSVFSCYLPVLLPLTALALATYPIAPWFPALALWVAKPWLDRTVLFALSRAAFGQSTGPADVWQEQRQVWWSQFFLTWIWRRLSPWRSFTQPVYQLEGIRGSELLKRLRQIRRRRTGAAAAVTAAFTLAEQGLVIAAMSLTAWFAPKGYEPDLLRDLLSGRPGFASITFALSYAAALAFLEPFYVGAGFALYLNRRAELEAWDIEQEFRRAFTQH
jgi:hypothetical protein